MHSKIFIPWVIILLFFVVKNVECIRVCRTFEAYYNDSSQCYDNPDTELSALQILRQRWNATAEEHLLTTDDNYQILIIRAYKEISHPTPIVVGHGLFMNCLGFLNLYNQSFVYHLIESGYQVFLINYRGTIYSTGYIGSLNANQSSYWKYSFHHHAKYDLPKTLELVKSITNNKAIYIGYSMGTTVGLAYASLSPQDSSDKLKGIITLSTTVFFEDVRFTIRTSADIFSSIGDILPYIGIDKFDPNNEILPILQFASSGPDEFFSIYGMMDLCINADLESISPEYFPVLMLNIPDAVSLHNLLHFSQLVSSEKFQQFDHGSFKNMQIYGTLNPPEYNLNQIVVPVAQFLGENDDLGTVKNAKKVASKLNTKLQCGLTVLEYKNWTHLDFILSRYQMEFLLPPLLEKIQTMESNSC